MQIEERGWSLPSAQQFPVAGDEGQIDAEEKANDLVAPALDNRKDVDVRARQRCVAHRASVEVQSPEAGSEATQVLPKLLGQRVAKRAVDFGVTAPQAIDRAVLGFPAPPRALSDRSLHERGGRCLRWEKATWCVHARSPHLGEDAAQLNGRRHALDAENEGGQAQ